MTGSNSIQLDQDPAAVTTFHKAVLTFSVKQDGQPYMSMPATYEHCNDAVVAFLTGMVVQMAGALGPKGKKAKDGPMSIDMKLEVDGAQVAAGSWDGLSIEGALVFERHVLETWLHMNQQSVVAAKARGKI